MESYVKPAGTNDWGLPVSPLFIVAGPCSAENRKQIMSIAKTLAGSGISFLRAGAWKPRTQPGFFEGVGEVALDWLAEARDRYHLEVGTEVGLPQHVEACLQRNIRIVWIGARTTPSPFIVQEIANAMRGTDMSVLIKNPLCPDVKLWAGAVERFYRAGIVKLIAVHRGFSTVQKSRYRYPPLWRLAEEMRISLPDLPMICDPSHICGNHALVEHVAKEALNRHYSGLMIEVHENPELAMSDGSQQLTPVAFHQMLHNLIQKK
jgi:chorismate mutase